jgi:hypothetical protein
MKEEPAFDKTPEFEHFKTVMRGVLSVPKERMNELVRQAKKVSSPDSRSRSKSKRAKRGKAAERRFNGAP